jgi:IS605 OrfB family transposase
VRCISKVADAYKRDKETKRTFKPHSAIAYDNRILSWSLDKRQVSIWTVGGRLAVPFVAKERNWQLLQAQRGECDLALVTGEFYLFATCELDEPDPQDVDDVLGVDLGQKKLATDSDGTDYSGSTVANVRHRNRRLRKQLQATGSKRARRKLKKLSGRERRFASNTNHDISKQIVETAQRTGRAIALEDLTGIRGRVRVRRGQRDSLHSWSFYQLRQYIDYKAQLAGVRVVYIDPRNTSRTCPACGCVDKRNRPNQATFLCIQCGHAANADCNAAWNIRVLGRAALNLPNVGLRD